MFKKPPHSPSGALGKLQQLCSRQEKCPADVISLLKRWEVEDNSHEGIVEKLKKDNFLNDSRFASAFVKDKIRFDHWGIIKIRYYLHQKGISKQTADEAINEIDKTEYRRMIGNEMAKKRKALKGNPGEIWAKLARYGSSRGYEMEFMHEFLGRDSAET